MDEVRCGPFHQDSALAGGAVRDADVAGGEVAQAAVGELRRPSRGAERQVMGVDEGDVEAPGGGVERDAGAGDTRADDEQIGFVINAQIGNISYVLCAIVGCIFALNNFLGFTIGKLVSFLTFNKSFTQPINQVSQQFNSIVMALAGADRIFKLLDEEPEVDDGYVTLVNVRKEGDRLVETEEKTGMWAWKHTHSETGKTEYRELKGALVMDDVDFGYTDDKIVLHNIDLYAEPGQKIAFVGSTGAGKTTITNLINRFYDIQDGKIRYDGININKIKKGDLVKVIAGKDINNEGKVIAVNAKNNTLLVEGINMVTKHTKPSMSNQQGGIVHQEAPIDASNVMLIHDGKPTRVGFKMDGDKKVRFAKSTGKVID